MTQTPTANSRQDPGAEHLIKVLRSIVGDGGILTGSEISQSYTLDWARDGLGECLAVVRPSTTLEVSRICALCNQANIAIIPQGGHTGLVGGAQQTCRSSIVLSTQRMARIEEIDPDNMTCTVQAGVVLEALQSQLETRDLTFGVSIGSQGSAQIGGLISTNAGGVRVLRYGMMAAQVLGLEMVLADGRVQSSITGLHKDNRGPDPLKLAIGAEGSLGIVTRASLRVLPRQRHSATAWVGCATLKDALGVLKHLRQGAHEVLSAFEVMSRSCLPLANLVNPKYRAPLDTPVHTLISLTSSMDLPLQQQLETLLAQTLEEGTASDAVIAQSDAQAAHFWSVREGLVEGHAKRGFHVRSDVSVRLGNVPEAAGRLETMLTREFPGWIPQTYGHLGDGNLHFNALPPAALSESDARAIGPAVETRIFEIITELEGSFSAEHGIGRKKVPWFQATLPDRHDLLADIKSTLDPEGILNPGCLVNTSEDDL